MANLTEFTNPQRCHSRGLSIISSQLETKNSSSSKKKKKKKRRERVTSLLLQTIPTEKICSFFLFFTVQKPRKKKELNAKETNSYFFNINSDEKTKNICLSHLT